MISIRIQLLLWLVPAFAVIFTAAGIGIHYSTRHELDARLDARLTALSTTFSPAAAGGSEARADARAIARLAGQSRAGRLDALGSVLTNLPASVYCEIWAGTREIHVKTLNLEQLSLPAPQEIRHEPLLYNAVLMNGDRVRIWAGPVFTRNIGGLRAVIALSRKDVDDTLSRLSASLITGGLVSTLCLCGLLISALQISLKPLRNLGTQASRMDAESLHERFPEQSLPADIRSIAVCLNSLMGRLEAGFDRERRFSADLAHELRTPLAAIRTTSEVAAKWPDQASPEDFNEIAALASGLQQTLDSLLRLARMESSDAERISETVHLETLIQECLLLHAAEGKARQLTWNLQVDQAPNIQTDPRLFRIILSNLISNAVEYAPENSEVLLIAGPDDLIFKCCNQAPSLAEEDLVHLAERLWRKDSVRSESDHSGLGLSIADACAKTLGMRLSTELDPQKRLCISIKKAAPAT
jgi:signal transduction histidine kinase